MSEERLMKTPEEVRQKARELLQMPKEEVLTKYMFQEQEIERLKELCDKYEEEHKTTFETWQKDIKENKLLHSIIKEVREYIEEKVGDEIHDMMYIIDVSEVLDILDKENK